MAGRVGHHGLPGNTGRCGGLFVEPGGGGRHVEEPNNGGALGAVKTAVPAADIVRGDAALFVGRTGQGDQGIRAGDKVAHLHRVPHRVDIRIRGLHPLVDQNGLPDAQRKPGFFGQMGLRRDADGQDRQIRSHRFPALQLRVQPSVLLIESGHGLV